MKASRRGRARRVLASLLALAMVLTGIPVQGLAEAIEEVSEAQGGDVILEEESAEEELQVAGDADDEGADVILEEELVEGESLAVEVEAGDSEEVDADEGMAPEVIEDGVAGQTVDSAVEGATLDVQSVSVSGPRVVADSSMTSGQVTTWDCVWLGSYPQTEVTASDPVYASLQNATYDSKGDATVGGNRYRRISKADATYSGYWSDDGYGSATYRYFRWEPVKWRVLEANGSSALVVADVALDDQRYNANAVDVTWEMSSVRSWLNGYGAGSNQPGTDFSSKSFYDAAFSSAQKSVVLQTALVNADSQYYGTDGGSDTNDRVFLLAESDVWGEVATRYGFVSSHSTFDEARRCKPSDYAHAMGAWRSSSTGYEGNCWWFLRSPGSNASHVNNVSYEGFVGMGGEKVSNGDAIRPALNLNLTSSAVSYAGTVSSDGVADEWAMPISITSATVSFAEQTYTYTGSAIKPAPTVKVGGRTLKKDADYTLKYASNADVGTATVTITGIGNYTGTKSASFTISARQLAPDVTLSPSSLTYTGSAQRPAVAVTDGATALVEGVDYDLAWPAGSTDAGTYAVEVALKGNRAGSATATYTIAAASVSGATVSAVADQTYTGSAIKPTPTVKVGGRTLKKDADYTLKYASNADVGTATVTITGKGNYKDAKKATFRIVPRQLAPDVTLSPSSLTYTGSAQRPAVAVTDGATALVEGVDYDLAWPAGSTDAGTYAVEVALKGNRAGSATATYTIAAASVSGATVSAVADQTYTGSAIKPMPSVTLDGIALLAGTDYTVSYTENVDVGSATVTVTGKGNYTGTKSASFQIVKAANPVAAKATKASLSVTYKPSAVTVTEKNVTVTKAQGAVTYANSSEDATAKAFVVSKATGEVTVPKATKVGTYTVKVKVTAVGNANYKAASRIVSYSIVIARAANPITAKATKASLSVTYKPSASTVTAGNVTVTKAQGSVTYANASTDATAKKFPVDKTAGKVTVPKAARAGTYEVKVKATAAGNSNYKAGSKTVTYKIVVAKAANPVTAKATKASLSVTYKPSAATVTAGNVTVTKAQGAVTYANASTGATAKKFTVNRTTGRVTVPRATKTGTYAVKVKATAAGNGNYKAAAKTVSYSIVVVKAANPMTAKAVARTVSLSALSLGHATVASPLSVSGAKGTLSYAYAGGSDRLAVNRRDGRVMVRMGTPAGTYAISIKVTAAGNANYKAGSKVVACKVTVR